jgi:hypothetical protein
LYDRFEEAADMFIRSVGNDEDKISASWCLLYLCRANILKAIITGFTSSNIFLQELNRLYAKATGIVPKVGPQSKLAEQEGLEFQLYSAYLGMDLGEVQKCIRSYRNNKELVMELLAVNIWLQIPSPTNASPEYWHERLQCLLRLCELAFLFIAPHQNDDIAKTFRNFENMFLIKQDRLRRKISSYSPFYDLMDEKHGENRSVITDGWRVYDANVLYRKISQLLASYICELILKADRDGRNLPNMGMKLASSQFTAMLQLDALHYRGLLKKKGREILEIQRWWAENLIKYSAWYPRNSLPGVTYMALVNKLPNHKRNELIINDAFKKWFSKSKNFHDFEIMLKCIIVFRQQKDKAGIDKFHSEMSKTKILSHPKYLPVGFEYYCGNYQSIPVGRHLSSFFSFLYNQNVISAIISAKEFINFAIKNMQRVNLMSPNALDDLTSLMEFTTSLVLAVGQEYCDFCLPQTYLVNYFSVFTSKPLVPGRRTYSNKNYLAAIKDCFNQVQGLLLQIVKERTYSMTVLRLIRLSILIGLNESTLKSKVFNLFSRLYSKNKIFSIYLEENSFERLAIALHNDLKEMNYDSLVIIHYYRRGTSKFAYLEKYGVRNLTYNSVENFRSFLQ